MIRVGESSDRVRDVQRHLNDLGIRDGAGQKLATDGIYRLSMQAAVIRFQESMSLPVTGDLDAATLREIPKVERREVDRPDHTEPARFPRGPLSTGDAAVPSRTILQNDPLHEQARLAVHALDRSLGRTYDDTSERMTASLACLAKANGFQRIDHVVLSKQGDFAAQAENVFVVQGGLDDPARRVAHMQTQDAVNTPIQQSSDQFQAHGLSAATQSAEVTRQAHRMSIS